MKEKDWNEWVSSISEQYDLNLESENKETAKQKKILEAAIHTFAEKGFSGASTNEIAQRAGVAEATIFKHYRSKKGLLLRLVIPSISKLIFPLLLRPVLDILDQEKPLPDIMEQLIEDRINLIEKNWKVIRVIIVESLFHPEIREALVNHVIKANVPLLIERVDQLKAAGKIRGEIPTYAVIRSFMSTLFGYLITRNPLNFVVTESEESDRKWLVDALLYGISAEKK
jgi:AcrR family transcriptional regulator